MHTQSVHYMMISSRNCDMTDLPSRVRLVVLPPGEIGRTYRPRRRVPRVQVRHRLVVDVELPRRLGLSAGQYDIAAVASDSELTAEAAPGDAPNSEFWNQISGIDSCCDPADQPSVGHCSVRLQTVQQVNYGCTEFVYFKSGQNRTKIRPGPEPDLGSRENLRNIGNMLFPAYFGPPKVQVPAYWLWLRRGAFTCVGWQVTLCDPIWQVTSRSDF